MNGFIVERLTNVLTVKNFAQEERETENFVDRLDGHLRRARGEHKLNLGFGTLTGLTTGIASLAVLAYGFLNIKAGKMQLGEVLAVYQVTAQLFVPIAALVSMGAVAQTLQVLGDRVYSVLDARNTVTDAPDAAAPEEVQGNIEFDHVSLQYEEGGPFAVRDVTFSVPAGSVAWVVGPTGCGKGALLLLLERLFDPTEGTIRIDGVDVRKWPMRTLRRAVANVLHDCQIFTGTIAENIAYGLPDAGPEEIERVARLVELDGFVQAQPGKYATRLGRGGMTLDLEQETKLALARALITRPAILTVDDSFAAIDEEVETRIRAAVREVMVNNTVLITTSRLSICEDADLVVVMRTGTVVQVGTHENLLAAPGLYRRMYMRQMGMDAVDDQS